MLFYTSREWVSEKGLIKVLLKLRQLRAQQRERVADCCCLKFICCQDKQAINCSETTSTKKTPFTYVAQNKIKLFISLSWKTRIKLSQPCRMRSNRKNRLESNRHLPSRVKTYPSLVITREKVYWSHWYHRTNDNYSNVTWRQHSALI